MSAYFLKIKYISFFIILIAISVNCLAQNRIDEMMRIAAQGDLDEFTSFMSEVRNRRLIDIPDSSGSTALMFASYESHGNIVGFLLSAGADMDIRNKNGTTALIAAVGRDHQGIVRTLLGRGADPGVRNNEGDTALMIAIRYEKVNVIGDLLLAGASFGEEDIYNVQNSDLYLELMRIASEVYRLDVVQYLLEEEVIDINAQTEAGLTTLMFASMYNAAGIARYLLEMGADPDIPDIHGNTALMFAVTDRYKFYIVDDLLKAGADPNIMSRNYTGETNETNETVAEWMPRREDQDNSATPLMVAALNNCNNFNIIDRLLEAGADTYRENRSGETARLWLLTRNRNHDSYDCLVMEERLLKTMMERYIPPPPPPPPSW